MNRYFIIRVVALFIAITHISLLLACDINKNISTQTKNYKEYISSFFKNNEFIPFELSGDLDLRTSIQIANLVVNNGYKISDNSKSTLISAFRKQQVTKVYELRNLYINENLELWIDYAAFLSRFDENEYEYIRDQSNKLLLNIISNWNDSISDLKLTDDALTRLNILLSLSKINKFVENQSIKREIDILATNEVDIFTKEKIQYSDERMIPYLYYFINLNVWKSKNLIDIQMIDLNISKIMENIKTDNYSTYYFYLPFIFDVKEYCKKGTFAKDYSEYNLDAIDKLVANNEFDWNSLWTALQYTKDIIPDNKLNDLLKMLDISDQTDVSQKQVVYLMNNYSNIYYYLYLLDSAKISLTTAQREILSNILTKNKINLDYSVKEYYYNLKINQLGIFDSSCFIPMETIKYRLQQKFDKELFDIHDAGTMYYLMLIDKEFSILNYFDIEELIEEQKKMIDSENLNDSINVTLSRMLDYLKGSVQIDTKTFLEEGYSFNENLYFLAHFKNSVDEATDEFISKSISNRAVEYGFSSDEGSEKLELEATFQIVYSCNELNID